ncbi:MAG: hypothetical protein AVDCRST_MAG45-1010, partial [uncultured Solirubrobacterales bacterium]
WPPRSTRFRSTCWPRARAPRAAPSTRCCTTRAGSCGPSSHVRAWLPGTPQERED